MIIATFQYDNGIIETIDISDFKIKIHTKE